jgi:hypothetical protein
MEYDVFSELPASAGQCRCETEVFWRSHQGQQPNDASRLLLVLFVEKFILVCCRKSLCCEYRILDLDFVS